SAIITGLILALILDPIHTSDDFQLLGWAAILAMSSKYVLALRARHLFNPAAIAVVITSLALGEPASWWIGTASMLPAVLIGGLLVVRKVRQEEMAGAFLVAAVVATCAATQIQGTPLPTGLSQLFTESPLIFFAAIMLTEPLTAPPTRRWKWAYGALTGVLFVPQVHIGALYSTPELALVAGNLLTYLVNPNQRVVLHLKRKNKLARDIVDFVFTPSQPLAFMPGQYMEWTLSHPHPDSRGNRRYFTLASSPTESSVHLGVKFYAQSSSFKRAMYAMHANIGLIGTQIAGDFTLPADPRQKLVFIAGGIGITPFRSMLKYLLDTSQRRDIVLIYVNRTADDIVYKDVLSAAETALGIKLIYTLTDTAAISRGWAGRRGRVSERLIREAVPDFSARTFYISGPPEMVRASAHTLKAVGVRQSQIKRDFFPGLV
ncbi:MAG TPA: RnfABCDGE type electron transport complex subunit D, partial [Ktedonobacterales bacterium]|nr:RnfABCDGE type electron transport complex subunit D [Ktedonobacterales bacterium]